MKNVRMVMFMARVAITTESGLSGRFAAMRRVLLVTHPFPPMGMSSGLRRPVSFVRHWRKFGYEVAVLTIHPRAYEVVNDSPQGEIPEDTLIVRAFGLDAARHTAIFGRYPRLLALPDRWVSWYLGAWFSGMRLIRQFKPEAIWSTYPVASAHMIGRMLARRSGLPWVAECRDPMVLDGIHEDSAQARAYRKIERQMMNEAARLVFVTPGAAAMYQQRYPDVPKSRYAVVPNGYEEFAFEQAMAFLASRGQRPAGKHQPGTRITLVHSGILYPQQRNPRNLFIAIRRLLDKGAIGPGDLNVVLRATFSDEVYAPMIEELHLGEVVQLAPSVPYVEAIAEMLTADGLLIFQSSLFNRQIPAKAYEYLRAARPILAVVDPQGDSAALVRDVADAWVADIENADQLEVALADMIASIREHRWSPADESTIRAWSRESLAGKAAAVLDDLLEAG